MLKNLGDIPEKCAILEICSEYSIPNYPDILDFPNFPESGELQIKMSTKHSSQRPFGLLAVNNLE